MRLMNWKNKLFIILFILSSCASSYPERNCKPKLYEIDWEQRCIHRNNEATGEREEKCYDRGEIPEGLIAEVALDWSCERIYQAMLILSCEEWK